MTTKESCSSACRAMTLLALLGISCNGPISGPDNGSEGLDVKTARSLKLMCDTEAAAVRMISVVTPSEAVTGESRDAIIYLGRVRSAKAAPVLCRLLTATGPLDPGAVRWRTRYPVSGALIEIGLPAARSLVAWVATHDTDETYRSVALSVLQDVVGRDLVIGFIEQECRRNPKLNTEAGRKRLEIIMHEYRLFLQSLEVEEPRQE
jgi:hypothetical protein